MNPTSTQNSPDCRVDNKGQTHPGRRRPVIPGHGGHDRRPFIDGSVSRRVFLALRLFLGAVFLYAGYEKALNPQAFAEAVYNYQVLPDVLVNMVALVLPWLELLIGICLVAGFWLPGTTMISTGLLTIFIGALVYNQARGLDIHCGCFSTEITTGPADLWTVARDIVFLAVSVCLTLWIFIKPAPSKSALNSSSHDNPESAQFITREDR